MEPHRRWPEERHGSSFAVRARRQRLAGMAGIGSLVAITGYLVGGGGDGAAIGTTSSVPVSSAVSVVSVATVATAPTAPTADTTAATALAASTTVSAAADAVTCITTYTVVAGDSWYGIADAASVEVSVLYGLNAAGDATMLFPGDSICLPDGTVVTTTTPVVTTVAAQAQASTSSNTSNSSSSNQSNASAAAPSGQPASSSHGS